MICWVVSSVSFVSESNYYKVISIKIIINHLIQIIEAEFGLLDYITDEIQNFEETEFWEIDVDDYRRFIESSMPMKTIQGHSELYSRLFRLYILTTFQNKGEATDSSIKEPSQTRNLINEIINGIDGDKGWEYAFRSREDLDKFIELLTCFFEQREYELPDEVIRLRKGSKTRVATRVNEIYKELSDRPLKGDNEFLDIVRILHPFSHTSDLYKTISR